MSLSSAAWRRYWASPFLCARSETGDAEKPGIEVGLRDYTVCLWFPTIWMTAVWSVIALNLFIGWTNGVYTRLMWLLFFFGHFILFCTLRSYALCVHTHPGKPSAVWLKKAQAGTVPSTACKRSGKLLPPRAKYVGRLDEVILSLDHYCTFIGGPVGHFNRAYFLQFITWATVLCIVGGLVNIVELIHADAAWRMLEYFREMKRLQHDMIAAVIQAGMDARAAPHNAAAATGAAPPLMAAIGSHPALHRVSRLPDFGWAEVRCFVNYWTIAADFIAAGLLGSLAYWQWGLAEHGRVTVAPYDDSYDRKDVKANLRDIFGPNVKWWWAPIKSIGPEGDGYEVGKGSGKYP